ncbi:MAG: diguanylate cyclase [Pseudomonadota bacterium]
MKPPTTLPRWRVAVVVLLTAAGAAFGLNPDFAVTQYRLKNWGASDGIPHASVSALFQASDGYLWVGTYAGGARFDGERFVPLSELTGGRIPNQSIDVIGETADGVLWFGMTTDGLYVLAPDGSVAHYGVDDGLPNPRVTMVHVDRTGVQWIGTAGGLVRAAGPWDDLRFERAMDQTIWAMLEDDEDRLFAGGETGLWTLEDDRWTRFGASERIDGAHIWDLALDAGAIWVGWRGGLSRYSSGQWRHFLPEEGLPNPVIRGLTVDSAGALWFGSAGGGVGRVLNGEVQVLTQRDGLAADVNWETITDAEGNVWISSAAGLTRISETLVQSMGSPEGLEPGLVWTLARDRDGAMWVGFNGAGVSRIDPDGGITPIGFLNRPGAGIVQTIAFKDGQPFIGTFSGVDMVSDDRLVHIEAVPDRRVRVLLPRRAGGLWVAPDHGLGILEGSDFRFVVAPGLDELIIAKIEEQPDGSLLIAAESGGIWRLTDERLERLDSGNSLFPVRDFWVSDAGRVWLATAGLFWLDDAGRPQAVGPINDLMPTQLHALATDGNGNLWVTSNFGVARIALAGLDAFARGERSAPDYRIFGDTDGMRSAEANGGHQNPYAFDERGFLWVPTTEGVAIFDTSRRDTGLAGPVEPLIERLLADGNPVLLENSVTLDAGVRRVEIEFTALRLTDPGRLRFRYRLVPGEPRWRDVDDRRVPFNGLPPGDYRFEVAASASNGDWSSPATMSFSLAPFWWQRTDVRVGALGLVGLLMLLYIRSLQARERMLEELVAARTDALESANEKLQAMARRDALTKLPNRREATRRLDELWDRGGDFYLAVLDLDHFKQLNDTLGHLAGDECLMAVGRILAENMRESGGFYARVGGEEFWAVFEVASVDATRNQLEAAAAAVARAAIPHPASVEPYVTLSTGLARRQADDRRWQDIVVRADEALYQAKDQGRNRIVEALGD